MSIPIRGLKRQEIINNWLNGKEDPDFEVVPTRAEGKYIVKTRENGNKARATGIPNSDTPETQVASQQDQKSQNASTEENSINEVTSVENDKNHDTAARSSERAAYSETPIESTPARDYISFDRELTNEILNQLKMINDDRKARDEKKQKKKELRRVIHKEFARSRVLVEGSSDEEEPQPIYIERPPPMRVRRRLNLLDRYK